MQQHCWKKRDPTQGCRWYTFGWIRQEIVSKPAEIAYLEAMFSKWLNKVEALIERLHGIAPPIRRSTLHSYPYTPILWWDCAHRDAKKIHVSCHEDVWHDKWPRQPHSIIQTMDVHYSYSKWISRSHHVQGFWLKLYQTISSMVN